MLGCEVVRLGAIHIGVEQLPAVVVELAPVDHGAVFGRHLPALVPQAAGAEHLVVLRFLAGGCIGVVEAVAHRHTGQRRLLNTVHHVGHRQSAAFENGRHDVGAVVVLVAYFAAGLENPWASG